MGLYSGRAPQFHRSPRRECDRVHPVADYAAFPSHTVWRTNALRSGHKKSCGCLKKKSKAEDLRGMRFGRLVAMMHIGTHTDRKAIWRCKCDCGRKVYVRAADLKSGNTQSCGCLGSHYAKRNLMEGGFYGKNKHQKKGQ